MYVKPNETVVVGRVISVQPDPGGAGVNVQLEVRSNESPQPENDFVRPKSGQVIEAYSADLGELARGSMVEAHLALAAGPFGERILVRSANRVLE